MIPTPWIAMVVRFGEGKKHIYWDHENASPSFHSTEAAAQAWADKHCRTYQADMVVVAKVTRVAEADVGVNFADVISEDGGQG